MTVKIETPQMGESISEATVASWMKQEGDMVTEDELIAELETDKVNLEVTAPVTGRLARIMAPAGSSVTVGSIMGEIEEGATGAASAPAPAKAAEVSVAPTPVAAPIAGGATVQVVAPTMGESISEATIASWNKKVGDTVAEDELLAELETDKVNLEVTAPAAGVLTKIIKQAGETVKVDELMAEISVGSGVVAISSVASQIPAAPSVSEAAPVAPAIEETTHTIEIPADMPLSPAVRKLVEENGVDPTKISGTGKAGRLTKGDVLEYMAKVTLMGAQQPAVPAAAPVASAPSAPTVELPAAGARETITPLPNIRKVIAKRLKTSQNEAALLTTYNEVDLSEIMKLRKLHQDSFVEQYGVKLGFMSFFTKAVIEALKAWPALNAEIRGDDYVQKNFYDIGIAVSTDRGLMVPVLRNADKMSFAEIELGIKDMADRARAGKIGIDEMQGGSFTITNGGVFGSMMSMPIINYPQSGILGMHAIKERPVVVNGEIVIRPMMYVAMTYDHRIVDGRESVSFLVKVKECLENPAKMLLGV